MCNLAQDIEAETGAQSDSNGASPFLQDVRVEAHCLSKSFDFAISRETYSFNGVLLVVVKLETISFNVSL